MEKQQLEELIRLLKKEKLTLAIAESITAGMALGELSNIPGISDVLLGGIISYKRETKEDILDVDPQLIDEKSAESQEVSTAMAWGLRNLFRSDVTASVTGAASIPGRESDYELKVPVGTVFLTILFKEKVFEYKNRFDGSPDEIRRKTVNFIYENLKMLAESFCAKGQASPADH